MGAGQRLSCRVRSSNSIVAFQKPCNSNEVQGSDSVGQPVPNGTRLLVSGWSSSMGQPAIQTLVNGPTDLSWEDSA